MTTLATVVVVVIATTVLLKNLLTNTNDAARNAIARANVTQQRPNDAATSPAAVDPIRRPAPIIALFTPSTLPSFLPAGIIFGSDRVVVILHMLNPTSTATNDTSVIISTDIGFPASNTAAATASITPDILGIYASRLILSSPRFCDYTLIEWQKEHP